MARLWRDYGAIGAILARLARFWRDWRDFGAIGAILARFLEHAGADATTADLSAVEERAFGADAHGDGVHLAHALAEQAQLPRRLAGGEHDAGVDAEGLGA